MPITLTGPRTVRLLIFVAAIIGVLAVDALPGIADPDPTHGTVLTRRDPETTPPIDAERVMSQAIQARTFAQAVEAHQQAEAAAALQRWSEAEALRGLAEAAAAVEAEQAAAASTAPGTGLPDDSFWDRIAQCETGGNWSMTGSRYSGGLGFYNGTWDNWGGREFADLAGHATREQQIIVANRVATQGYDGPSGHVAPVGYSGWGCVKKVGYP